ncbi:MAG: hypothetical protein CR982_08790 [Candidatus Cloacimonadota bacterium]|nr:MAG: hypothetical protein CR982_08790 [Candidatus Cloacimonadota bacterium]PIE77730.1 MAG: hypothetical protein CSA15_11445 [Candidatus Delongbacteria bacterium]
MKKLVTILLAVFMTAAYSATTISGGEVAGIWNAAGSPYNVQGEILVPDGQKLTLDATGGPIVVNFEGHYKLNVQGVLETNGTSSTNTVTFTRSDDQATGWGGIRFIHTDQGNNTTSSLEHIIVEYGNANGIDWDNYGGGIFINPTSKVTIKKSEIRNCTAAYDGGGIYTTSTWDGGLISGTIVKNCTALGNGTTGGNGGGIYLGLSAETDVVGVELMENKATSSTYGGNGGGIYLYKVKDGTELKSVAIAKNSAKNGGGIFSYSSELVYSNLTVADNTASGNGGGIAVFETNNEFITGSIFWGNSAGGSGAQWYETVDLSSTKDFNFRYSMVQGGSFGFTPIAPADPKFDTDGDKPYALTFESPRELFDVSFGDSTATGFGSVTGSIDLTSIAGITYSGGNNLFDVAVNGGAPIRVTIPSDVIGATANNYASIWNGALTTASVDSIRAEAFGNYLSLKSIRVKDKGKNYFTITQPDVNGALDGVGIAAGTYSDKVAVGSFDASGNTRVVDASGNSNPDLGAYEYQIALPSANKPNFVATNATAKGSVNISGGINYSGANNAKVRVSYNNSNVSEATLDANCTGGAAVANEWNTKIDFLPTGDVINFAYTSNNLTLTANAAGSNYFRVTEPHQQEVNALTGVGVSSGTYAGLNATVSGEEGMAEIHTYEGELLEVKLSATDGDTETVLITDSLGLDTALGMALTTTTAANTVEQTFSWTPAYDTVDKTTGTITKTVVLKAYETSGNYHQEGIYTLNIVVHDKDQVLAPATVTPNANTSATPISVSKGVPFPITFNGVDPDGETLSCVWSEGPNTSNLVVLPNDSTTTLNYSPTELGERVVRLNVTDNYTRDALEFTWYFQVMPQGWSVTNTGNNMTVIFEREDLSGLTATTGADEGDYIAAFFNDGGVLKCGGFGVLPDLGGSDDFSLTVWGDDTGTPEKDGFDVGEPLEFRLYNVEGPAFYKLIINNYNAVNNTPYTDNDGLYGIDDIEGSDLNDTPGDLTALEILNEMMPLRKNWSIVSSYIVFDSPSMENIFSSVSDKLIIAKNNAGDIYSPIYGVDQINVWNITEGYKVKMVSADSIPVVGVRTAFGTDGTTGQRIPVLEGWNMFPFYGEKGDKITDMFYNGGAHLVYSSDSGNLNMTGNAGDNHIELMKNQDGIVWVPGSVDDLDSMKVWQGYQTYINPTYTGGETFAYGNNTTKESFFQNVDSYIAELPKPKTVSNLHWNEKLNTGNNATIIILAEALSDKISEGDEVAAFDSEGNFVGSAVFTGGNLGLTIWGDNLMTTNVVDGLELGEEYSLRAYRYSEDNEYSLLGFTFAKGSKTYVEDGINVISEINFIEQFTSLGEIVPRSTALYQNYPNPFNPTTTINFDLAKDSFVKLAVYNHAGQLVKELINSNLKAGTLSVTWDGTDNSGMQVSAGVYFYRMSTDKFTSVKKAIMVK